MRVGGPLISAAGHALVLGLVTLFIKSEVAPVDRMIELFSAPAPPESAAKEQMTESQKQAPALASAPVQVPASLPRVAPALAAAKLRPAQNADSPRGGLKLDLTLDGDGSEAPADALSVGSSSAAGLAQEGPYGLAGHAGVAAPSAATAAENPQRACPGGLVRATPILRATFIYPAGVSGTAGRLQARLEVSDEGVVERVNILTPVSPVVDEAAKSSLSRWRFAPARRCGKKVAGDYVVALRLELSD
jgi:outer membrane biosynthesis protein TonB